MFIFLIFTFFLAAAIFSALLAVSILTGILKHSDTLGTRKKVIRSTHRCLFCLPTNSMKLHKQTRDGGHTGKFHDENSIPRCQFRFYILSRLKFCLNFVILCQIIISTRFSNFSFPVPFVRNITIFLVACILTRFSFQILISMRNT